MTRENVNYPLFQGMPGKERSGGRRRTILHCSFSSSPLGELEGGGKIVSFLSLLSFLEPESPVTPCSLPQACLEQPLRPQQPPQNGELGIVLENAWRDLKRLYLLVLRKQWCSGPSIHTVDPRDVIFQYWLLRGQPASGEICLLVCFHTGPRAFSKHPEIQR